MNLDFSDLIFDVSGTARYKKVPGKQILTVPEEFEPDVSRMFSGIQETYKKTNRQEFQFLFDEVSFRVSRCDSVDGDCYFVRRMAKNIPSLKHLGYPKPLVSELLSPTRSYGLVIFAGRMGSGKTTSASAFLKDRLSLIGGHAISLEDPPELPLQGNHYKKGACFQQDISGKSMSKALVQALRFSSPEIIFLGELREDKAASQAIRAALNGHLILCTIHASGIEETLSRLIALCRKHDGDAASRLLADAFNCVIWQRLKMVRMPEGDQIKTVIDASYLLIDKENETAVRSRIRANEFHQLKTEVQAQKNRFSLRNQA